MGKRAMGDDVECEAIPGSVNGRSYGGVLSRIEDRLGGVHQYLDRPSTSQAARAGRFQFVQAEFGEAHCAEPFGGWIFRFRLYYGHMIIQPKAGQRTILPIGRIAKGFGMHVVARSLAEED